MENFSILSFDADLCIVISNTATEYQPLVLKSGNLYDPTSGFKPVNAKYRQKSLITEHKERAKKLISQSEHIWQQMKAQQPEVVKDIPVPAPAPAKTETPQSTLDNLIAKSVAAIAVDSVMEVAKPAIDTYISKTYGMIPKVIEVKTELGTSKVVGQVHKEFSTVLQLAAANIPVFLTGPAGCGKNVICKQIAEALGLQFYFSNAVTQEYKLTGFIDANGHYHETQFFKAFTQGGVFMLDEMDASTPEVLVILNAAIANGYFDFPTGRCEAHKDFRIVAAGNTYGTGADIEYTGRFQLDASSLDRFAIIDISYDKDIERAIAENDNELLNFIWDFRKAINKANIKFTVSYRAIERLFKLKSLFDIAKAIQIAILRGMDKDDAKLVSNNMTNGNKYTNEFKKMFA